MTTTTSVAEMKSCLQKIKYIFNNITPPESISKYQCDRTTKIKINFVLILFKSVALLHQTKTLF